MIDLTGKVALVTGSSRGIGKACALRLAEAGADVAINFVTAQAAAIEVAEEIRRLGRRCLVVRADVSEREDVQDMIAAVESEFGQLDILVHNAATGGFRPLMSATEKNFEAAMNTNVRSFVYLLQAAAHLLESQERRGKVVAAFQPWNTHGATCLRADRQFQGSAHQPARHFALELGDRGVNFNVVEAGLVETDSMRRLPHSQEMFAGRKYKSMMGDRYLEAGDVADATLFLCSPLSDLVQGQTLIVDGGAAIHI